MQSLNQLHIDKFRAKTFRTAEGYEIRDIKEAVSFVNERGFIFFWPIKELLLPSLWTAVAGERPVADAHDDPGHITWGWKDSLVGKREWYYAKFLRKKSTMISFEMLPYFYALSENYGSYEEDYLTIYQQGRLTQEEKRIYETLLENGEMDSIELKQATYLIGRSSEARFNRAIVNLQANLMILPVNVVQSGGWRYAFTYDITARHYPEIVKTTQNISEITARRIIIDRYLKSVGAAQLWNIVRLFRWPVALIQQALQELLLQGSIIGNIQVKNHSGEWFAMRELV